MNKAVIVIPIYKVTPDKYEVLSFLQCLKVLHRYRISIVTYESLDMSYYSKELQKSGVDYSFEFFDKDYFKDVAGYNLLLLSFEFYKRFKKYEYMLIYQLDAYVFRDELMEWCAKGYDYIGAPWFEGGYDATPDSVFTGVGNGGFSLRKISTALNIYKWYNFYKIRIPNQTLYEEFRKRNTDINWIKKLGSLKYLIFQLLGKGNNARFLINRYGGNEDLFWVDFIPKYYSKFKIASIEEGYAFSFEMNPSLLFKKNNNKLPFGCHAWEKYEYEEFWKKHIKLEKKPIVYHKN